jgi:carbon-monoxide dehydrogenase medium subunit
LALKRADPDARWLAGGMTLLPSMKLRLAAPTKLIDLSGLADLDAITVDKGVVRVGAMVTHGRVASSAEIAAAIPALSAVAAGIGDPQVRNRGTIGGSVANNDPAADYPAALLGLGATLVTNVREISADEFFVGLFDTALADDELLTAVEIPRPRRAAYVKFRVPASRYALIGVFVAETNDEPRVAVTGAGNGVYRDAALEAALKDAFEPDALAGIAVTPVDFNDDMHGSARYRAHLVSVLARRAVAAACADRRVT